MPTSAYIWWSPGDHLFLTRCATLALMSLPICSHALPLSVSSVPWKLAASNDGSSASLLLSVADVQASIYFVSHPEPEQSCMMLQVACGPALESSLQLRFMGHSDTFDEKSFKGLEFLYKTSNTSFDIDAIERGLRQHWMLCLAERIVEVMLCTGSLGAHTTAIDIYAESCHRIDMIRNALSEIKPGHVGASAALVGGVVYYTPSSGDLDGLLDLTKYTGLRNMWMKGSLEHPCEETVLFKNTDHIVISHLVSQEDICKAIEALHNSSNSSTTSFDGSSSWPLLWFNRSEWEVEAAQRMVHSTTDSLELIKALIIGSNLVDSNHPEVYISTDRYIKYAVRALTSLGDDSLDAIENIFSFVKGVDKHKWLSALMCAAFTESLAVRLYGKNWRDRIPYEVVNECAESTYEKGLACDTRSHFHEIMTQLELSDDEGLWSLLEMTLNNALVVCSFLDRFQDTGLSASVALNRALGLKKKDVYSLGLTHPMRVCHLILLLNETLIRLVNMHVFVNAHENPYIDERDVWESDTRVRIVSAVLDLMKSLDKNELVKNTTQDRS